MPRITFTSTRIVNDRFKGTDKETRFEAGSTYDLPAASCEHWKSRGAARDAVAEEPVPAAVYDAVSTETVVIPDDWADLNAQEMKAVASHFSAEPVGTKAEAVAVIEAELARRAADETADSDVLDA